MTSSLYKLVQTEVKTLVDLRHHPNIVDYMVKSDILNILRYKIEPPHLRPPVKSKGVIVKEVWSVIGGLTTVVNRCHNYISILHDV